MKRRPARRDHRLVASTAQPTAAQGSAGTAKTSTVLTTYADAARAQDYTVCVSSLAPTANTV